MITREILLEAVNALNHAYAGRQVGFINGYRNQWFIGGSIKLDEPMRKVLELHFCQGRKVGRINFNGGYTVEMDVTCCESVKDVFNEFELLDHHKRREKDRLDARCTRCVNYLGRLTGNCAPSLSCGYQRIRPIKGGKTHVVSSMHRENLQLQK